jgi:hypothetical protein
MIYFSHLKLNSSLPLLSEVGGGGTVAVAMAHLVEALIYKPESRGFDSGWCHWNFSLT